MGLVLQGYYFYEFVQLNAEARVYHSLKNLGPKFEYNEAVTSAGIVFAYGNKQKHYVKIRFVFNRIGKRFSLGIK